MTENNILELARTAAEKRMLFLLHITRQITRPDRMISTSKIKNAVMTGEIIEDYPEDARGHSCLILGFGLYNRSIHIVCAPKDEYLAIITAYIPNSSQWADDFRRRR